ncbi:MAG: hypothetical protein KDA60_15185 [Planctomycetales bacterium]|nr:hypothetical protein [Planctomycetales bacterium]
MSHHESAADDAQDLSQIREILFGRMHRDLMHQIEALESRLTQQLADLRQELHARSHDIENFAKNQFAAIDNQFNGERTERHSAVEGLLAEAARLAESITHRSQALENRLTNSESSLREHTQHQTTELRHSLQRQLDEVRQALDQTSSDLGQNKTDRGMLSELLHNLAEQVRGQENHHPGQA